MRLVFGKIFLNGKSIIEEFRNSPVNISLSEAVGIQQVREKSGAAVSLPPDAIRQWVITCT